MFGYMCDRGDIGEPMPFVLTGVNEEMVGNSVEDHAKERKLLEVEHSLAGKAASKEEHHRLQCLRVELKELLGGFFHVLCNCHDFRLI